MKQEKYKEALKKKKKLENLPRNYKSPETKRKEQSYQVETDQYYLKLYHDTLDKKGKKT